VTFLLCAIGDISEWLQHIVRCKPHNRSEVVSSSG
jgi:hypothetical protein